MNEPAMVLRMLLKIKGTNLFMTLACAGRLKVNFGQESCQAVQAARSLRFKANVRKVKDDFMICYLDGIDVVLGYTFMHYYDMKFRQRPCVHIVMVGSDRLPRSLSFSTLAGLDCTTRETVTNSTENPTQNS